MALVDEETVQNLRELINAIIVINPSNHLSDGSAQEIIDFFQATLEEIDKELNELREEFVKDLEDAFILGKNSQSINIMNRSSNPVREFELIKSKYKTE